DPAPATRVVPRSRRGASLRPRGAEAALHATDPQRADPRPRARARRRAARALVAQGRPHTGRQDAGDGRAPRDGSARPRARRDRARGPGRARAPLDRRNVVSGRRCPPAGDPRLPRALPRRRDRPRRERDRRRDRRAARRPRGPGARTDPDPDARRARDLGAAGRAVGRRAAQRPQNGRRGRGRAGGAHGRAVPVLRALQQPAHVRRARHLLRAIRRWHTRCGELLDPAGPGRLRTRLLVAAAEHRADDPPRCRPQAAARPRHHVAARRGVAARRQLDGPWSVPRHDARDRREPLRGNL
ncbi:MAG: hypothetical protein AVDCRST_MAG85-3390, partial [uncultured Solirubrobacteraceae bacterium]